MFSVSAAVLGVSQKVVEGVSHGEDVSSVVGSVGVGGLSSQGVLSSRNEVANGSSSTTRCTEDEDEDGDEVGDELAGRLWVVCGELVMVWRVVSGCWIRKTNSRLS